MTRCRALLFVASCWSPAIAWAAQAPATPPRDATAPAPADPGTVRGIVTRADTGDPLPGALVSLNADDPSEMLRRGPDGRLQPLVFPEAVTDERGRFVLQSVPAGRFVVRASKTGYVSLQYGQRTPSQRARRIQVEPAATVDAAIALPRGAVIAGQVLDEHGEPHRGALVRAVRRRAGSTTLTTAGSGTDRTDDLGMFRLHGLVAGTYLIEVSAVPGPNAPFVPPMPFTEVGTLVSYYPAARAASGAEPVRVGSGEEIDGLTVVMPPPMLSTIVATVSTGEAQPASDVKVYIMMQTANGNVSMRPVPPTPDGRYVVSGLAAGRYALRAAGRDGTIAFAQVHLDGADVTVPLTLGPGTTLRGRVLLDGQPPPSSLGLRMLAVLTPSERDEVRMPEGHGIFAPTFEIRSLVGWKRLRLEGIRGSVALQRITRRGPDGETDVTDGAIDFPGDGTIDIDIHLTSRVTSLSGSVRDAAGAVTADASVIVFADDRSKWGAGSRFVGVAHPSQDGRFTATGLPPGRYLAVGLGDFEPGEENDLALLDRVRAAATAVTLAEGDASTADVRVAAR